MLDSKQVGAGKIVPGAVRRAAAALVAAIVCVQSAAADPVDQWIARQKEIRTLSADFEQVRHLRALKNPLRTPGRIAFRAPDDVRWELGDPARAIFLRTSGENFFLEPQKDRVRRIESDRLRGEGLMDVPFVSSRVDLKKRFRIEAMKVDGRLCTLELVPRADGRLAALTVVLDTATGALAAFDITLRDGSRLRNVFRNVKINEPLPDDMFAVPPVSDEGR